MAERTLADEISAIARYEVNQIPVNKLGRITKNYPNSDFVDVELLNGDTLVYLQCIGSADIDDTVLIVFIDGKNENPIAITSSENGGEVDLKDYVKKVDLIDKTKYDIDLNLNFGLKGEDDTIVIDMDIVDHIVNKRIDIRGV